jgi:hypothetical protein
VHPPGTTRSQCAWEGG